MINPKTIDLDAIYIIEIKSKYWGLKGNQDTKWIYAHSI